MAEKQPQSFKNHAKIVPGYHIVTGIILLILLAWAVLHLVQPLFSDSASFDIARVMWLLLVLALISTWLYARLFPLAAQDRIIRLEMRLRLHEVLPEDLRGRIAELTAGQMIGLRFASDAEMPDLVREVRENDITDRTAIKKKIKDWQADDCRF